jgi:ClpP class serine protease
VLAAEQIASALAAHEGPVTVYVPHYAMSGGTLIALAADRIVLSPSAVLGPVDPQLGEYAAASILAAVSQKDANETDDKTLILPDQVRQLMRLYPQPRNRRPSVEYLPIPHNDRRPAECREHTRRMPSRRDRT